MINTFTNITEDWCKIANLKRYRLVNVQFYATSTNTCTHSLSEKGAEYKIGIIKIKIR